MQQNLSFIIFTFSFSLIYYLSLLQNGCFFFVLFLHFDSFLFLGIFFLICITNVLAHLTLECDLTMQGQVLGLLISLLPRSMYSPFLSCQLLCSAADHKE